MTTLAALGTVARALQFLLATRMPEPPQQDKLGTEPPHHPNAMDWNDLHCFLDHVVSSLDEVIRDMKSDDDVTRRNAIGLAVMYCEWMFGPMDLVPREVRQKAIEGALRAQGVPAERARLRANRGSSLTGVPGAPLTTRLQAVRALNLRIKTGRSYRQIAYTINGPCEHVCPRCKDAIRKKVPQSGINKRQPRQRCPSCQCTIRAAAKKEHVCSRCAPRLRASIRRLIEFLRDEGVYPPAELPTRPLYF
jgi:hypothetical protein